MQFGFPVFDAVALQLCCTSFILPEDFHKRTRAKPERRGCGLCIAILCRHDVKDMGDKQRKLRIARLDMPVATRKFHLYRRGFFADIQRERHLHAV